MTLVNVMPQKVLFLAGVNPILKFELVKNFIFHVQVLVTASDWAKVMCSHRGVQGQKGCRGLKTGTGTGTRSSVSLHSWAPMAYLPV